MNLKQDPIYMDKDNCGFGLVANINNKATYKNTKDSIFGLSQMIHRGAVSADGKSADGSGLLFSMPHEFFSDISYQMGFELPSSYAVGMFFIGYNTLGLEFIQDSIKSQCEQNDLKVLAFRTVPIDKSVLGPIALKTLPKIIQAFIVPNSPIANLRFKSLLYLSRKKLEHSFKDQNFYVASMSNENIVYKALVIPTYIDQFYPDLKNPNFKTRYTLFHQRFSTNTMPKWPLAQPFRTLAHNGEINSITANVYNFNAKVPAFESSVFSQEELDQLMPIIDEQTSDSGTLDNVLEFLLINNMDFFKVIKSLIPAPWQNEPNFDSELRAFYEYYSNRFEAWDGPAAISVTDGRYIACTLDRNGLRPCKYIITEQGQLIIASEYGVLDINPNDIVLQDHLQGGETIALDLANAKLFFDDEINKYLQKSQKYEKWLTNSFSHMQDFLIKRFANLECYKIDNLKLSQRYHNYTNELIEEIIKPMAKEGKENTDSMSDDIPLACFSQESRSFCDYFRQKVAQVTNPPIDPIRESSVMSLATGFGLVHNLLKEEPAMAKRLQLSTPILFEEKLSILLNFGDIDHPLYDKDYTAKSFYTGFKKGLRENLEALGREVIYSIKKQQIRTIVLDDRVLSRGEKIIPMVMVVGYLNKLLLDHKLRYLTNIVCISGELIHAHSIALLLANGASAVYPYLIYATLYDVLHGGKQELVDSFKNLEKALNMGILKIMSKTGISTLASYKNSSLFDILGLSREITELCFTNAVNVFGGLSFADIEARIYQTHFIAMRDLKIKRFYPLEIGGFYKYVQNKEYHDWSPITVHQSHKASINAQGNEYNIVKDLVNNRSYKKIRDFFQLKSKRKTIDLNHVEPVQAIFKRFSTAAMNIGSISEEVYEVLAEAMNQLDGRSNSDEGGKKPSRLFSSKNSTIKQVASGRFGVTPEYLVSASEIQIKVSQGAKSGEGGQLSDAKVTNLITSLSFISPDVTLISPPPHHDIYSIEDLSQLIFDLKQINPMAQVSVKLVSSSGIGTIAAGVAKAYADKIVVLGSDGGTGAAAYASIKYAGNPLEIGLAEVHDTLKANNLRGFVHIQTDGGLKTGLDIIKEAILGAESFAFAAAALVAIGYKMLHTYNLNRCLADITTQEEVLRKDFAGSVQRLVNYFTLLAQDVRTILADLGYQRLEDVIGQRHLLEVIDNDFTKKFNFDLMLRKIDGVNICQVKSNQSFDDNAFEKDLIEKIRNTIKNPNYKTIIYEKIRNIHRSFGALISHEITKYYGNKGLEEDSIKIFLEGVSGQSLGAFLNHGISIQLKGSANDYIGKGMHGGKISIIHPKSGLALGGNTCLYGATGGTLYMTGRAGGRFAVRNSGALAVLEGAGDHACEYMTGGTVVILGPIGVNFGAGMTGGVAFIYDPQKEFIDKMNQELIQALRIDTYYEDEGRSYLKQILNDYFIETGSPKAKIILDNFRSHLRHFWMVIPKNTKFKLLHD